MKRLAMRQTSTNRVVFAWILCAASACSKAGPLTRIADAGGLGSDTTDLGGDVRESASEETGSSDQEARDRDASITDARSDHLGDAETLTDARDGQAPDGEAPSDAAMDAGMGCPARDDAGSDVLACELLGPRDLALAGGHLYWLTYYQVFRLPNAGGGSQRLATEAPGDPYAIASDGRDVYWTSTLGGRVTRWRSDTMTLELIADRQPSPGEIAVDDASVYWVAATSTAADSLSIRMRAKAGGPIVELARRGR